MNDSPSITITHVLEHLYCPRFNYQAVPVEIDQRARHSAQRIVREVLDVIRQGYLPQATRWKTCW